jgi:hypothetical protein
MTTIKLVEIPLGPQTELDGQYVVEYDPFRTGTAPSGKEMICHLVCTNRRESAKQFSDAAEAFRYARRHNGMRLDGGLNRPLTAYTLEIS